MLKSAIDGLETSAITVDRLKYDKDYNFTFLKENLEKEIEANRIKNDIRPAAYINRILDTEDGIIKKLFSRETVNTFIESSTDTTPWWNETYSFAHLGSEDVLAMALSDGWDFPNIDESMLHRLSECVEKYINSGTLFSNSGSKKSAYKKLIAYMIRNKKGQHLDIPIFANNILAIKMNIKLDIKTLLDYANNWEYQEIKELTTNVRQYLDIKLFTDYLTNKGNFTDGLIRQGIKVLEEQHEGFLRRPRIQFQSNDSNYACYSYWKHFVMTFVGTEFMNKLNKQLTKELVLMLNQIIETNGGVDQDLLDFMLKHEPDADMMKDYLCDVVNDNFTKTDVTVIQFKVFGNLLPKFMSVADINSTGDLALHFIKPVYTDKDCAQIIVDNKKFYFDILKNEAPEVLEIFKD